MAPLEAIIDGEIRNLGLLKRDMHFLVNENLSYYFADGKAPDISKTVAYLEDFIKKVVLSVKPGTKLSPEEKEFIDNTMSLYAEAVEYQSREFRILTSLRAKNPEDYAHECKLYGKRFAMLAKNFGGYSDPKNPKCPTCPHAESGVTQQSWEIATDPMAYYDSRMNRLQKKDGIFSIDLNLIEPDK